MDHSNEDPSPINMEQLNVAIEQKSSQVKGLIKEINKVIIGQEYMVESLLIGLLGSGHILLEGLPGLAKTLAIKTLADAVQGSFSRIQFTPDLLPADVVGTLIYNMKDNEFEIKKGPIFAHFVLADEINRAPAKVQSALLEAMEEKQVTIGNETYPLPEPFLVMATQNPVDQEGTYSLPEAQADRFMLKCSIDYPSLESEREIMRRNIQKSFQKVNQVFSIETVLECRKLIREIFMDEKIETYILDIVFASRFPEKYGLPDLAPLIHFGGSPRASINLAMASRVYAFLNGRGYVLPEDVRHVAKDVLRHRIGLTFEAEAEEITTEDIIEKIINKIQVP